ncbi:CDIP1 protein, partial [Atractosteus spatula]|nr:CDIP1 protein [Atractosteus spatula]
MAVHPEGEQTYSLPTRGGAGQGRGGTAVTAELSADNARRGSFAEVGAQPSSPPCRDSEPPPGRPQNREVTASVFIENNEAAAALPRLIHKNADTGAQCNSMAAARTWRRTALPLTRVPVSPLRELLVLMSGVDVVCAQARATNEKPELDGTLVRGSPATSRPHSGVESCELKDMLTRDKGEELKRASLRRCNSMAAARTWRRTALPLTRVPVSPLRELLVLMSGVDVVCAQARATDGGPERERAREAGRTAKPSPLSAGDSCGRSEEDQRRSLPQRRGLHSLLSPSAECCVCSRPDSVEKHLCLRSSCFVSLLCERVRMSSDSPPPYPGGPSAPPIEEKNGTPPVPAGFYPPPGQFPQPIPGQYPPSPGHYPAPGGHTATVIVPPGAATTVTVLQGEMFQEVSVQTVCPHCQQPIVTRVSYDIGLMNMLFCLFCCFVGCNMGCCLIPCLMDNLKDVTHTCPYCKGYIYTYKRMC